jgi:hypothetical protein
MPPIVTTAEIERPAAEVFAYATDPARLGLGPRTEGNRPPGRVAGSAGHVRRLHPAPGGPAGRHGRV